MKAVMDNGFIRPSSVALFGTLGFSLQDFSAQTADLLLPRREERSSLFPKSPKDLFLEIL